METFIFILSLLALFISIILLFTGNTLVAIYFLLLSVLFAIWTNLLHTENHEDNVNKKT